MNDDAEAKLAAPKLFGRKKGGTAPPPAPEPDPEQEPVAGEPAPTPEPEAAPEPEAVAPEPVAVEPVAVEPVAVEPVADPIPVEPIPVEPAAAPAVTEETTPAKAPRPRRERPSLPTVNLTGMQMAGVAGILVGLFLVLATDGSLHLCASVRGADTCGGKAGFPLLVAIGILAVVGGGALLRLGGVRSPMGDSFLAVALVAVITVLFLGGHYDAWWMLIAVPLLGLLAYLLAHWVSVKYIDPVDEDADRVSEE